IAFTQTSVAPVLDARTKAMLFPSGENAGLESAWPAGGAVSIRFCLLLRDSREIESDCPSPALSTTSNDFPSGDHAGPAREERSEGFGTHAPLFEDTSASRRSDPPNAGTARISCFPGDERRN